MNSPRYCLLYLVLSLLARVPVSAARLDMNSIISVQNSFPNELVQVIDGASPPTVIQVIEGAEVGQFQIDGTSVLNLLGGTIAESVYMQHTSQVNMFAGTVGSMSVTFDSVANVYGGLIDGDLRLSGVRGTPSLNLFGGRVEGSIASLGGSIINIHGGYVAREIFGASGRSIVNVTGGSFNSLAFHGSAVIHWSGGEHRNRLVFLSDDAVLHDYDSGLAIDENRFLSGTLLDETTLANGTRIDLNDNTRIFLHNVPEPASVALAVLALPLALLLSRRARLAVASRV